MENFGAGFCFGAAVFLGMAASSAFSAEEMHVMKDGKPWVAPASAARKRNPVPADGKSIDAGKQLFTANCLACHGAMGNGDGPAAAALDHHPGVLSDPKMWSETDGALFWKITEGNTPMPTFRDALTADQRWQVIDYIRTLAPKPATAAVEAAPAKPGKKAYVAAAKPQPEKSPAPAASEPNAAETEKLNQRIAALNTDDEKLKLELEDLKALVRKNSDSSAAQLQETKETIDDLDRELLDVKKMAKESYPGTTKMLIGGYGTAGFHGPREEGSDFHNAFSAAFNPLMLWKISDRILFEGEIELQLEGSETTVNLEVAQVSYLLNDYMTLGAGRFLNPMNFFVERQHMGWVNKFPDKPLAVYDGLLPESMLGMQLRGGIPAGSMKFEYSVFAANPPTLNTTDSLAYGTVEFGDVDNVNNHMAVGGRIGFIPHPHFEIGYGMLASAIGPEGRKADVLMQSVDVNAVAESPAIKGLVNLRGQWVWQNVDKLTYDADGTGGFGPKTFDNSRNGGYVSLSYRPEFLKNDILRKLEPGIRFDMLNQRDIPTVGFDEWKYAFGLDYWIYQNVVIKGAYEIDRKNGTGTDGDAILGEFITGF